MRAGFPGPPLLGGGMGGPRGGMGMPPRPGMPPFFPGMPPFGGRRPPFPGMPPQRGAPGAPLLPGNRPTPGMERITPSSPSAKPAAAPNGTKAETPDDAAAKPNATATTPNKGPVMNPARMEMIKQGAQAQGQGQKPPHMNNHDAHKGGSPHGGVGQKRFGGPPTPDSTPPSDAKKFRPSPQQPPNPQQQQHLFPLRNELAAMIAQTPPQEMATLACAAVTGAVQPIKDEFATQLIEATFDPISNHLGLQRNDLGMFRDRVCAAFRTELTTFLEKTYQTELVQLLVATTHTQPHQDLLLRNKVLQIIREGDQGALMALRAQINKFKELRLNPQPSTQPPQLQNPQVPSQQQQPQQQPQQPAQPQVPQNASTPAMEASLCTAALSGDIATVTTLLTQGVNINSSQEGGWSALMNATLQGHLPVVKHLVAAKAQLDLKDNGGFTALMYAASYNRVQIAEELVQAGASLDIADNAGRNISHYTQDAQVKEAVERGKLAYQASKAKASGGPTPPPANAFGGPGGPGVPGGPQAYPVQGMQGMPGQMAGQMPGMAALAQMAHMAQAGGQQQQQQQQHMNRPGMMPQGQMHMMPGFAGQQGFGR